MIRSRRTGPRRGPPGIPSEEWRNPTYRRFLVDVGRCVICLKWPVQRNKWWGFCDPAHTEHNGMSSKGRDASCAPLCRCHHNQYDGQSKLPNGEVGHESFEAYYRIDMKAVAAEWWKRFQGWRESSTSAKTPSA